MIQALVARVVTVSDGDLRAAMKLFAPLVVGGLDRYRPMPNDLLARSMINAAEIAMSGTHTYRDIARMAG